MKKYLSLASMLPLFFFACTKQSSYTPDTVKPEIKIIYPVDKPAIPAGNPLCMKVLVSDNKSLTAVWLQINDGNGYRKEFAIPGRSMEIIEKYISPPGLSGNLAAKFFAIDEAGNISSEEIMFSVNN